MPKILRRRRACPSILSIIASELGYKLTVLIGRERLAGLNFATAVPMKGSSLIFMVDNALGFIEEVVDMK